MHGVRAWMHDARARSAGVRGGEAGLAGCRLHAWPRRACVRSSRQKLRPSAGAGQEGPPRNQPL
jgi:hypothetical protein